VGVSRPAPSRSRGVVGRGLDGTWRVLGANERQRMTLPNFLIIGAGRAGTTSLNHYLGQHPDVFMSPIKETNFFAYRALAAAGLSSGPLESMSFPIQSLREYRKLFDRAAGARAIGEASPIYMADRRIAEEISDLLPDVRLIAILRNPVERAHSSYLFHRRDGRERRSFDQAIREEREGLFSEEKLSFGQRSYLGLGFYDRMLAPYFDLFPRSRIGVFLFDHLLRDPADLMSDLFGFLHVDPAFEPAVSVRYNASGVPRGAWATATSKAFRKRPWTERAKLRLPGLIQDTMDRWIEASRARRLEVPELPKELQRELVSLYAEDIAHLQQRIGRDLQAWLMPPGIETPASAAPGDRRRPENAGGA